MQQIAETLNNLGNLYRLTGEFYDARLLCQTGILLRQAWGLDTVMSLYVMSMILWEMGDTAASMAHLTQAQLANAGEDEEQLVVAAVAVKRIGRLAGSDARDIDAAADFLFHPHARAAGSATHRFLSTQLELERRVAS